MSNTVVTRKTNQSVTAALCLAGAVILWGTSFMATKVALTGFAPQTVIWLRMMLAACLVLFMRNKVDKPKYQAGDWKILAVLCLMQPCLYFLLEGYAISLTTSAQAGMISALVPLLVTAGAWLILKEPLSLKGVMGLIVSIGGVVLLSLGGSGNESSPNPVLGNVLEIGAMIAAATYMVVMKQLSTRYCTWWLTGLQCVAGAIFFLPGGWLGAPVDWELVPASAWIATAYLGGFVTLGAFGLYNLGMTYMAAGKAALAINMVPPVALLTGWLLLGEGMTSVQLMACGIIGVGVFVGRKE